MRSFMILIACLSIFLCVAGTFIAMFVIQSEWDMWLFVGLEFGFLAWLEIFEKERKKK